MRAGNKGVHNRKVDSRIGIVLAEVSQHWAKGPSLHSRQADCGLYPLLWTLSFCHEICIFSSPCGWEDYCEDANPAGKLTFVG